MGKDSLMKSPLHAAPIPEIKFSSQLRFIYGGQESIGQGELLSLNEILGKFVEPLTPGKAGQLVLDLRHLRQPLALEVAVQEQTTLAHEGILTHLEILEKDSYKQKKLAQFYIASLWRELTDKLPQDYLDVIFNNLVAVIDPREVSATLVRVLSPKSPSYLIVGALKTAVPMKFERLEGDNFFFELSQTPSQVNVLADKRAFVFCEAGFRQYLFMGRMKKEPKERVKLSKPVFLLTTSLRQEERIQVDSSSMWAEIPLPYPRGAILRLEVIDISSAGVSLRCLPDSSYFLPGTPISSLKVVSKSSEPFITSGQVCHVKPMKPDSGETYLKIGVQFQISNKTFARGHDQPKPLPTSSERPHDPAAVKRLPLPTTPYPLKQLPKDDSTLPHKNLPSLEASASEEARVFRHLNRSNQEILGLLNTTWRTPERRRSTVIVLPSPFGKRKEALGLLVHYLLAGFRKQFHDAAIVRYDTTNTVGESYKDPDCRFPGRESLHMVLSAGTRDLLSILDFVENNEYFLAREVVLVSFSLSALHARKAILEDPKRRIHLWVAPMGVTNIKDLMVRVSGGIDYFGLYKAGKDLGDVTVLGTVVSGNRFCEDAIEHGYVSLQDATKDMSRIDVPVIWLYGVHDAWVDSENVEQLLSAKKKGFQKVRILPTGHLPLNGEEALQVFDLVFHEIWPHLSAEPMSEFKPSLVELSEKQEREWQRVPREMIHSKRKYWAGYLLGTRKNEIGYDILRYCEEYIRFIQDEIDLLDLKPGHLVADMGCGTGNLPLQYLEDYRNDPKGFPRFVLIDIVPEALARVSEKCGAVAKEKGILPDCFQHCEIDLDIHPALPLQKFILGEYSSIDQLKGQVQGLTDYSIDLWKREYGPRLHEILRGKSLTEKDRMYLEERFPETEKEIILEFNSATRTLKQILLPEGLEVPVSSKPVPEESSVKSGYLHLDLNRLDFHLPFPDNCFDRVVSSIVLPYMKNPLNTLAELSRTLRPGGVLVVSTMKPDTDMSTIYSQMVNRINSGEIPVPEGRKGEFLTAVRNFANAAAQLLQLVEERRFHFFSPEELLDMVQTCGLKEPLLRESYGKPHQAYIVQSRK